MHNVSTSVSYSYVQAFGTLRYYIECAKYATTLSIVFKSKKTCLFHISPSIVKLHNFVIRI